MSSSDANKNRVTGAVAAGTTVPAAARTLALFEVFARECRELTKSELARLLDLPESSCSDLLNTLHELGYVSRTASTRRFYPTGRLLNVASAISKNDALGLFGAEAVAVLSQRVNETCSFGIIDGERVKILAVHEGEHRLRYVVKVGDRVSVHGTALGKALLGACSPEERARILRLQPLRRLTKKTKTEPTEIEREVREAEKSRGWFKSEGEGSPGVWSLAVSGYVGTMPVGLSMIGPEDRMQTNHANFLRVLLEVKEQIFGDVDGEAPATKRGVHR